MPAGATSRDPFMPRSAQRTTPALLLAVIAHLLLIAALAFGVNWHSFEPTQVAAELWSAVPQAAAPREIAPPPTPVETPKPTPVVKAAPPPPPAPTPKLPDPQIAIEKARREDIKRAQAADDAASQRKAALDRQRLQDELARQQAALDKLKADMAAKEKLARDKAEKLKADKAADAIAAAARDAQLKRMQKGLQYSTGGPTDIGSTVRSSGPSANYAGRIMARIKPNILFTDSIDGNPRAVIEVKLAPDGTIIGKRLVESSGVKAWDDAVMRAIERTEILPLDNGTVPAPFQIGFRPRD
jgi:colicin import membrane protein